MEIRTKRLLIKPIEERDAQAMCAIFDSDIVKKTYMIPDLATEEAKTTAKPSRVEPRETR